MTYKTNDNEELRSTGNSRFENGVFSRREWSALTLTAPREIKESLDSFKLEGRKIKRMKMIGLAYALVPDWMEEQAYRFLKRNGLSDEEIEDKSRYENINDSIEFDRFADIDEPILIEFEDGDVFEFVVPEENEYRFSMNCIPWDIGAGINQPNVDADTLFSPAIGRKVIATELKTDFYLRWSEEDSDEDEMREVELVDEVIIWLDGDIGISISGYYDYCHVYLITREKKVLPILFSELKQGLHNERYLYR